MMTLDYFPKQPSPPMSDLNRKVLLITTCAVGYGFYWLLIRSLLGGSITRMIWRIL